MKNQTAPHARVWGKPLVMSDAVCAGYLLECDSSLASGLEQRQALGIRQALSEKKSKVPS